MNNQTEIGAQPRSRRSAIGGFLMLTGVAAGGVVLNRAVIQPKREARQRLEAERKVAEEARQEALRQARKTVDGHLSKSDKTTAGHIEIRVGDIERFFNKAKRGVPAFSKEMLGWGSKWKLIKDKAIFWREEEAHKEFVEEKFAEHVFTSKELEMTIRKAVEDFVARDGQSVNNQFLTLVRGDVPIELLDSDLDPDRFQEETRKSIEQNFESSASKAYGDVGAGAVSFVGISIASAIAAQVLVRVGTSIATKMGLSAGIIGAGAAASPWTLGATLIAAVLIDLVLGWAINYFTDPEGDLTQTIQFELTKLERLIIEGSPKTDTEDAVTGIRQELQAIADLQSQSRREAMDSILDPDIT